MREKKILNTVSQKKCWQINANQYLKGDTPIKTLNESCIVLENDDLRQNIISLKAVIINQRVVDLQASKNQLKE